MHTKLNDQIRKVLFGVMLGGIALFLSLGASGSPVAHAQEAWAHDPGAYYTVTTVTLSDGNIIEKDNINGPPVPPPGFEVERQAVSLPEAGIAAGISTLIAGYYDRLGWSNIYTGPTNGGVMPLDNSSWPTWSDGFATYPSCPLIASKNGVDGRTTRGSIDDYWVKYNSTASDPYITNGWTQHTWGDAIGDCMYTSQSAFGNVDGATTFYNWTSSSTPLTCDDMASYALDDGTLGRKLFYEARGYTVTDCYNQKTDNTIAGGFSFAQFKAEIDAGRPVMLNLAGHTVVGVGYDDSSNLVYIHDTWDYNNHTMTWGGSYSGMALQSVSIVNIQGAIIPTVQFSAANSSGSEATTPASIAVTLSAVSGQTVTVNYATANGTATGGSDYMATSGTLTFNPGVTSQTISVPIINDTAIEGNEAFTVTLSGPVNATLGATATHTYTINDDDNAGAIQFSLAAYSVNESGGSVLITVTRTGGSSGAVGVSYVTNNGTATAGSDYTSTSGTLSWVNGDTSNKTFSVSILNDSVYEGDETVNLTLNSPTGGATLGFPSTAVLTIIDDDPAIGTYILTVNVNPVAAGSITKNPDKTIYNSGEMVQLTANANSGYSFSSWSGDVFGNTNPISFIMDSNKSVTANFSATPFESVIFVSLDGTCNGYTPCSSTIQNAIASAGAQATIRITQETYVENVILNTPKEIILQGGWDSAFTNCLSSTTINGSLTISDGTLIIENIILQ
jgi:YD repeat-containing protein